MEGWEKVIRGADSGSRDSEPAVDSFVESTYFHREAQFTDDQIVHLSNFSKEWKTNGRRY